MRFRLLDMLACPRDGAAPLRLQAARVVAGRGAPPWVGRDGPVCARHCSHTDAPGACRECWAKEIAGGELACPQCGARFPIRGGIPSFVRQGPSDTDEQALRDEQAEQYDRSFTPARNRIEMMATYRLFGGRQDDVALEAGAGTGRMTAGCAARCRELVALDFSLASLKVAARKVSGQPGVVHLVHGDVTALPFRAASFDRYLSAGVFQHLPGRQGRERGLAELRRVMKPGGTAVLSVYNYNRDKRRADKRHAGGVREREGMHSGGRVYYYRFEAEELRAWLSGALEVRRVVGFRMPRVERMGRLGLALEWLLERTPVGREIGYSLIAECRVPAAQRVAERASAEATR